MTTIWAKITTRFEALHMWPESPREVYFLKFPHRHMFHVTVWVEQFHEERDVEYILFKRWLDGKILNLIADPAAVMTWSCETWARNIMLSIEGRAETGVNRRIKVEVTEDGENGALVEL